jgi:hypothetical protein
MKRFSVCGVLLIALASAIIAGCVAKIAFQIFCLIRIIHEA